MFSRGKGPLVSVLLPTRGRPKWLAECVDSLYSLAKNPRELEFLFKVDTDDTETQGTVLGLAKMLPARVIISPRGRGYLDLHEYVNALSAAATGDWLFIFNDDARMLTQDWDEVIRTADPTKIPKWGGSDEVALLAPQVRERDTSWEFPILRRRTYQILGHFSRHLSSDSWIYWVMSGLDAAISLSQIEVTHFVNDVQDQVNKEGRAAIQAEMPDLSTPELKRLQELDRSVIRQYMTKRDRRIFVS